MLAIIGGTGIYDLEGLRIEQQLDPSTPFGAASGAVARGRLGRHELLFLARHGSGHRLLPHEVNYRANIFALKRAGATQILGISAVGSLADAVAPGHFAMPSQYFDWTRGNRERSFFGGGVAAHVSTAEPVSASLVDWVAALTVAMGVSFVVLLGADRIRRWIGASMVSALEKLMGLVLTAIAVEMILAGLKRYFFEA